MCSLLFPIRCPICDEILEPEQIERGIHIECESKIFPVKGAVCMHCGRPIGQRNQHKKIIEYLENYASQEYCYECEQKNYVKESSITQAKSLYLYRGKIKQTMYRFKYKNKREYARFFAREAVLRYRGWLEDVDVIVPVPMYLPKQKKRGYNQAESFATELSRYTGIPVDKNLVVRIKDTRPQKELNDKERKNNLKNAFQIEKSIVQYSHALIVDDIYTTGSTAEAVGKEIKRKGNCQVYLLSICIGGDM